MQLNREQRKGEANCLEQDLSGLQSLVHSLDLTSDDPESQLFFSVHSDVIKLQETDSYQARLQFINYKIFMH